MLPVEFVYSHQIQPVAHQKRSGIHKHDAKDPNFGESDNNGVSLKLLFLSSFYNFPITVADFFPAIAIILSIFF